MPRHLIVSCGTSQLEKAKARASDIGLTDEVQSAIAQYSSDALSDGKAELEDMSKREATKELVKALANKWSALKTKDVNNPFGAEISTLAKMQERGVFSPNDDWATIISTDTQNGGFCAVVLKKLLTHDSAWRMDAEHVKVKRVPELREGIDDPTSAEKNLSESIMECYKEGVDKSLQNISVVTGGYKSVIPFFTVMAFLKKMPMYYLFEGEGKGKGKLRDFVLPEGAETEVSSFIRKLKSIGDKLRGMGSMSPILNSAVLDSGNDDPQI